MAPYIHWFRRDLRMHDNPALNAAAHASGGRVIPLFIVDDVVLTAARTGTDARPYFRIFNPTSQGQKFDPRGAYVRRYVPELARVPDRYIHTPWTMPLTEQRRAGVLIGRDYPEPIVDHAERRAGAGAVP